MSDQILKTLGSFSSTWATWFGVSILDAAIVLVLAAVVWLLIHKKASAQFGYCLFLLVLLKLLVPLEVVVPQPLARWTPAHLISTAITALPAANDPLLARVRNIRERDFMFIDTVQDYYAGYAREMRVPYDSWREQSYDATVTLRELQGSARRRFIAGTAVVLGGIAAAANGTDFVTQTGGAASVGAGAYVGAGTILLPGIVLGECSIVGAGAVVTKDIPPYCVAVGVPARVIRQLPTCGLGEHRGDRD